MGFEYSNRLPNLFGGTKDDERASFMRAILEPPTPAPEREKLEYTTEEPTGLLNQHGRPIYRVRRVST